MGGCKVVAEGSARDHFTFQNSKLEDVAAAAAVPAEHTPIPETELAKVALVKTQSLQRMLSKQMELHVQRTPSVASSAAVRVRRNSAFNDDLWKELPLQEETSGFAEIAEKEWDIVTEEHLGPAQRAELLHVRNMMTSLKEQIATLNDSLEGYRKAERELLLGRGPV